MYRLFLDNTLTYSCGIHSPGGFALRFGGGVSTFGIADLHVPMLVASVLASHSGAASWEGRWQGALDFPCPAQLHRRIMLNYRVIFI